MCSRPGRVHDPDWGLFSTRTDFLVHQKHTHTQKKTNTLSNITTLQNMTLKGGKKNLVGIYQFNTKIYDIQNILSPNLYLQKNFGTYLDSLKLQKR